MVKYELQETEGFAPLVRWFHVLPLGNFYYNGEKVDCTYDILMETHLNTQKLLQYNDRPAVLLGIHASDNETKTRENYGFVVDTKVVMEHPEASAGLWAKLEIRHQETAEKIEDGRIDGISLGWYMLEDFELPKTGEKLSGYYINHATLTNEPHLTWLDSNRKELQIVAKIARTIAPMHFNQESIIKLKSYNFEGEDMDKMEFEKTIKEKDSTIEELRRELDNVKSENENLKKAELEKQYAELDSKIDGLAKDGKVLPADVDTLKETVKELEYDKACKVIELMSNVPKMDLDKSAYSNPSKDSIATIAKRQAGIKVGE